MKKIIPIIILFAIILCISICTVVIGANDVTYKVKDNKLIVEYKKSEEYSLYELIGLRDMLYYKLEKGLKNFSDQNNIVTKEKVKIEKYINKAIELGVTIDPNI